MTGFDLDARTVQVDDLPNGESTRRSSTTCSRSQADRSYSYFGHDDWAPHAPELKTLDGALDLRDRILSAFEAAEVETRPGERQAWLTFVVVGAGPTGVEMAGQIAELARDSLPRRVPPDGHASGAGAARRSRRPRPQRLLREPVAERGTRSSSRSASRRCCRRPWSASTSTSVELERRTAAANASLRGRRSGRRASPPRRSRACSPRQRAPRPTAPAGSSSTPT